MQRELQRDRVVLAAARAQVDGHGRIAARAQTSDIGYDPRLAVERVLAERGLKANLTSLEVKDNRAVMSHLPRSTSMHWSACSTHWRRPTACVRSRRTLTARVDPGTVRAEITLAPLSTTMKAARSDRRAPAAAGRGRVRSRRHRCWAGQSTAPPEVTCVWPTRPERSGKGVACSPTGRTRGRCRWAGPSIRASLVLRRARGGPAGCRRRRHATRRHRLARRSARAGRRRVHAAGRCFEWRHWRRANGDGARRLHRRSTRPTPTGTAAVATAPRPRAGAAPASPAAAGTLALGTVTVNVSPRDGRLQGRVENRGGDVRVDGEFTLDTAGINVNGTIYTAAVHAARRRARARRAGDARRQRRRARAVAQRQSLT